MPRFFRGARVRAAPLIRENNTMVKIRLARGGAKGRPFYHVVVTDERNARDGRNIERLGFYNPVAAGKEVTLQFDVERAKHWIGKGAQATAKVKLLMKQASKTAAAA
jgi:small subunit ribosomal protein S16